MEKAVQLSKSYKKLENFDLVVDPSYWYDIKLKINGVIADVIILYDNVFNMSYKAKVVDGIARFEKFGFNKFAYLDLIAITDDENNAFCICNFLFIEDGIHQLMSATNITLTYTKGSDIEDGIQ